MWTTRIEELPSARGVRIALERDGVDATFRDVFDGWSNDAVFRGLWNRLLADSPCRAFRWETPPLTLSTSDRAFECVLLDSPGLDRPADPHDFAEHFPAQGSLETVVAFANLGGDAIMVVPAPLGPGNAYGHLAAFVRKAPENQRDELWRIVAAAMERRLSEKPVWLSTAGGGVAWLHVRLDDRPKYYGHEEYRRAL
ncbi:MAG TPA: hypothetical protein VNC50_20340 [Planctomycetia bacterium]|nr:hypothetical protein [Planctomycetia bacterium]